MPMTLMHAVALALAATVTMWLAPMSLWRKSEQAGDAPSESPARVRDRHTLTGLHPYDRLS